MDHDIFISLDRLPKKPSCSTDPKEHGILRRARSSALQLPYIQLDPPGVRLWMAFDVADALIFDAGTALDLAETAPSEYTARLLIGRALLLKELEAMGS